MIRLILNKENVIMLKLGLMFKTVICINKYFNKVVNFYGKIIISKRIFSLIMRLINIKLFRKKCI